MPTQKNGYDGPKLQGVHTTVLEDGVQLLRGIENDNWLVSVRAGWITGKGRGGKKSITIGQVADTVGDKTLRLVLKAQGAVQELFLQVESAEQLPAAINRITSVARKRLRGIDIRLKVGVGEDE